METRRGFVGSLMLRGWRVGVLRVVGSHSRGASHADSGAWVSGAVDDVRESVRSNGLV